MVNPINRNPFTFSLPDPQKDSLEDTAEYPAVSPILMLDDQTRLSAYWDMLQEYVDRKALRLLRTGPISVLELRCGEASESGTLCAYLGGCQDRFDLNEQVHYTGIHDDEALLESLRDEYKILCKKKLKRYVPLFSFATQLPERAAPINEVLVLNHFDTREAPFSEWKSLLQQGLQYLMKNGIVIATANWTDDAPDLRHILSDKCRFLCDQKNKHSPFPGEVYDHIIVAQKTEW